MNVKTVWRQQKDNAFKKYLKIGSVLGLILLLAIFFVFKTASSKTLNSKANKKNDQSMEVLSDVKKVINIEAGMTYGLVMENMEISAQIGNLIYQAASEYYDLATIRAGKELEFYYDSQIGDFIRLEYNIDSEEKLIIAKDLSGFTENVWRAQRELIPYTIKEKIVSGEVKSSMYQAALDNNIDERAIIELANAFQWSIDFAMDPRVGDTFKFIFEERYLDGEYIMPGKVLAGQYINAGIKYEIFYFEETDDNKGYFDRDGNSVQKMFLKAPVAFQYISSGFTTGNRYISSLQVFTGQHRAIDYAAPSGTPIRAVGDGTVIFAGWSSVGYGYLTSIRHNSTYTTNYAHQSKIAVSYGQKVKQGEVIGYVGSTGFSTGPHLHYEMVKNGIKINPLNEVLPPGKPILDENKERFNLLVDKFTSILE